MKETGTKMSLNENEKTGPKKEDRRVRRTKKLLTAALTSLLGKKQVNEITVKELTDLADINRGTFYLYYRDVYDMLESIEDELFAAFDEIVEPERLENGKTVPGAMLLDLFEMVKQNQEMCRVLLSANGDMSFLHRLNEVVREKCHRAWMHLPAGKKGRAGEDVFDFKYSFAIFGCAGIIREWVNNGCREDAGYMAELTENMINMGIGIGLTDQ